MSTMELPDHQPLYHVAVLFREGYGETFRDLSQALDYAILIRVCVR